MGPSALSLRSQAVRKVDLESSQQQQQGAKKRNPMEDLKREIMIMKKMKHNNIVNLSEVIDDPAGSKLLLVSKPAGTHAACVRARTHAGRGKPGAQACQRTRACVCACRAGID